MVTKLENAAIVTLYDEINIGNKLQNYALQRVLNNYFKNVTTLTYSEARLMTPLLGWKGKIALKLGFPKSIAAEKKTILKRWDRFREFSNEYLNISAEKSFSEYNSVDSDRFNFFVVGSDQVWHDASGSKEELNYFMLQFVDEKKRVCYAPSFGFDSIPEEYLEQYTTGLKGFEILSCREKKGCQLIKELTGRVAELMPDPTLGLTTDEWIEIEKIPEYIVPKKYILAYFIGPKTSNQDLSLKWHSNHLGLPIIDVFDKRHLQFFTTRPDEFIYLIHNAELLLTNSFHGAVFALIFNKTFKIYQREDSDGKGMESRLTTLIEEFGLQENEKGVYEPSLKKTTKILKEKRRLMNDYLCRAFHLK